MRHISSPGFLPASLNAMDASTLAVGISSVRNRLQGNARLPRPDQNTMQRTTCNYSQKRRLPAEHRHRTEVLELTGAWSIQRPDLIVHGVYRARWRHRGFSHSKCVVLPLGVIAHSEMLRAVHSSVYRFNMQPKMREYVRYLRLK